MKRTLTARRLEIPFKGSFKHASADREKTDTVWVTIESGAGGLGLGEGCPRDYVTGETVDSALSFIETIQTEVVTLRDVEALWSWVSEHRRLIDAHPSAWCAVELALLDVMARERDQSVETLLGLPRVAGPFRYTAVLGADSAEVFAAKFQRYLTMGFRDFKVKLSGDEEDFARAGVLGAASDAIDSLRLDANNLWPDPAGAIAHLRKWSAPFFAIEEPLAPGNYGGMRTMAAALGTQVILDESFLREETFGLLQGESNPWIINLRVSKMGGILRSLEIAREAQAASIPLILGCQVGETSLLTRAALTVAVSIKAGGLRAQEGAFGTHLLQHDVVTPELMFGSQGRLEVAQFDFEQQAGFGLRSVGEGG